MQFNILVLDLKNGTLFYLLKKMMLLIINWFQVRKKCWNVNIKQDFLSENTFSFYMLNQIVTEDTT